MLDRLVDLAVRRPWALLTAILAVLAVSLAIAVAGAGGLPIGSPAPSGSEAGRSDLIVATTGRMPASSPVYRVALRVISSQVRADSSVAQVRQGPVSGGGRSTSLLVSFNGLSSSERQDAVERIQNGIDPGPLEVAYGGEVATLLEARHDLVHGLWKLELLAMPFAALVLVVALGPRLAAAPVLSAATAISGTLAGLVIIGLVTDVSLLGIAPAAVLGLVLGVQAPASFFARYRAEAQRVTADEAIRRAVIAAAELAVPVAVVATLATTGLLATDVNQAGSMVVASGLAAVLALASALVCAPAIVSLAIGDRHAQGDAPVALWLERRPARLVGWLAGSGGRTIVFGAIAALLMLAAAAPLVRGHSVPFSAADLPQGSSASRAAGLAGVPARDGVESSLFADLPLAAAVSAVAMVVVFGIGFRSRRVPVPLAVASLLPAAAACGLCVLVFQDGHLAGAINQSRQGALETGAVASLLVALVAVSAARSAAGLQAARDLDSLGLDSEWTAYSAASLILPAAVIASLIGAAATGVLAGADIYSAREFGLAVAVGLLIDVVLLRPAQIATLARWGPG